LVEKIMTHAGFDVTKINVEVTLNKPIQISNDLIAKYNDIIQLVGNMREAINPSITNINQYQILVELGIPVNVARLMCSKSSISVLQNSADLKKFLLGQKEVEPTPEAIPDAGSIEECTKVDMIGTSKQYLKENYELSEDLKDFYDAIKKENPNINRRTLQESLLKPKETEESTEE